MGLLAAYGLIVLVLVNILFFGPFIYLFYLAIKNFSSGRMIWVSVCLALSTFPVLLFGGYMVFLEREKSSRMERLADLTRTPISDPESIRSLGIISPPPSQQHYRSLPNVLIAAGLLDGFAYLVRDPTEVVEAYRAESSDRCVRDAIRSGIRVRLRDAPAAKNAFRFCSAPIEDGSGIEAPIWLYQGNTPNGNQICPDSRTLELRWSPDRGGDLIEFVEILQYRRLSFLFVFPNTDDFIKTHCRVDYENYPGPNDLDPFYFVTRAFGLGSIDGYPQRATATDAVDTLRIMNQEKETAHRPHDGVVMLLGQWPSSPALSDYIRTHVRDEQIVNGVLNAMFDRSLHPELVPHLRSHAPDFLAICDLAKVDSSDCDRWRDDYY